TSVGYAEVVAGANSGGGVHLGTQTQASNANQLTQTLTFTSSRAVRPLYGVDFIISGLPANVSVASGTLVMGNTTVPMVKGTNIFVGANGDTSIYIPKGLLPGGKLVVGTSLTLSLVFQDSAGPLTPPLAYGYSVVVD